MSKAVSQGEEAPEMAVRNRSQYADTLHGLDSDADDPQSACVEAECRENAEFTDVPSRRPLTTACAGTRGVSRVSGGDGGAVCRRDWASAEAQPPRGLV